MAPATATRPRTTAAAQSRRLGRPVAEASDSIAVSTSNSIGAISRSSDPPAPLNRPERTERRNPSRRRNIDPAAFDAVKPAVRRSRNHRRTEDMVKISRKGLILAGTVAVLATGGVAVAYAAQSHGHHWGH